MATPEHMNATSHIDQDARLGGTKNRPAGAGPLLITLLTCLTSALALYSAYSAQKSVAAAEQVVHQLEARVSAVSSSQERVERVQDSLAKPVRREFIFSVPAGAKHCRIVVEGSALEASGSQNIQCN